MLRWRLLLGTLIVAGLVGLCWLDHRAALAGVWLFPIAVVLTLMATGEMLHLARCGGLQPLSWPVYTGNLAIITASWLATLARSSLEHGTGWWITAAGKAAVELPWPMLMFGLAVMLLFVGEIVRYQKPGGITSNLASAVLCLAYVGLLMGLLIEFRMTRGVEALALLVLVVKLNDTGAYTVGRILGRHKMAPRLSPGKTVEGAVGGVVFACLGSWAAFHYFTVEGPGGHRGWAAWPLFAILVASAGIIGDLAESLLKRDVQQKDSSNWLPGFGGVLDIIDSILLATPVAYVCYSL